MELIYDVWFSKLDLKNDVKLELLKNYSTEVIWYMKMEDFLEVNISECDCRIILKSRVLDDAKMDLDYMLKNGIQLLSIRNKKYPQKLKNIDNPPAFLYVRGNEQILDEDSVRNCRLQNGDK